MTEQPAYRPARFLLVEDSEGDIYIFRRALREARILNETVAIRDGEEAWTHLLASGPEQLPDLMFLDINLPRLTGLELLDRIKGNPELAHIPVVMLTISQEEEDILTAYERGALSFISKTIQPENLLDVVSSLETARFNVLIPVTPGRG